MLEILWRSTSRKKMTDGRMCLSDMQIGGQEKTAMDIPLTEMVDVRDSCVKDAYE